MNDKVIQIIRTSVPGLVGLGIAALGKWLLNTWGLHVDLTGYTALVAPAAVGLSIAGYTAAVQWLQKNYGTNPIVQYLLGHPALVAYLKPGQAVVDSQGLVPTPLIPPALLTPAEPTNTVAQPIDTPPVPPVPPAH